MKRLLTTTVITGLIAGCGGSAASETSSATTDSPAVTEGPATDPAQPAGTTAVDQALRPAEEARAEAAVAGPEVAIGDRIDVLGVGLIINSITAGGDDGGGWVAVDARAENPGTTDSTVPWMEVRCSGNDEAGGWQADSSLYMGDALPAGSFDEGVVNLNLPGDSRTGDPVPTCDTPAYITFVGSDSKIAVPDAVIAEVQG